MAAMVDVHRRDDTVEEVAEEQVPPLILAADPVDDVANDDSVTEELLENEGAKLETTDNHGGEELHHHDHTMKVDNIIKAASIVVEESSALYEVETSTTTVSTTTEMEELVLVRKRATTSVEEEEMGESGVEMIELEYDPAEEVTELELEPVEGLLEYYCKICVAVVKKVVSCFESALFYDNSILIDSPIYEPIVGMPASLRESQHPPSQESGFGEKKTRLKTRDGKHTPHENNRDDEHPARARVSTRTSHKTDVVKNTKMDGEDEDDA